MPFGQGVMGHSVAACSCRIAAVEKADQPCSCARRLIYKDFVEGSGPMPIDGQEVGIGLLQVVGRWLMGADGGTRRATLMG